MRNSRRTKRLVINIQPELVAAYIERGFRPSTVAYRLLRDFALKQNIIDPDELKKITLPRDRAKLMKGAPK